MRIKPKGSKEWRAKAASPAYERRDVHHVGYLARLEHQMATWKVGQKSPDRMDTAVHAILHLSGATPAELVRPEGRDLPTRSTRAGIQRGTAIPRSTMVGRR
jgi:phage terminase large subunit-like protein